MTAADARVQLNANHPVASGATPRYTTTLRDEAGVAIPGSRLSSLSLTICDPLTGATVNGAYELNILNADRGTIDEAGALAIQLRTEDTRLVGVAIGARVLRSLVVDWRYPPYGVGRKQIDFPIVALAEAS